MDRTIAIQTPFGRDISFVELSGSEGLSKLYEYKLILTSKNPNLAAQDIIGQTITVSIDTRSGTRPLNGLVTDFGYLSEDEDEQSYYLYSCIMRPNMWYLTQRYDSRVFVDKDVLEITRTILDEFGFPYEIQCLNNYRKYGHSTQYQETSFNYLNRLFEQEGLYYYFDHNNSNHTLIIVDDNTAHPTIQGDSTIAYHSKQNAPGTPNQNYLDDWRQTDRLATKTVSVNDHNYQTAKSKLGFNATTHKLGGINTEHYDFYTSFTDRDTASHYGQIRAQDYQSQSKRIDAAGNVLTIAPGHIFKLSRHPHNAANIKHLIIEAHYDLREAGYTSGSEQSYYRITFTAIPLSYQYRASRDTPKPQVVGSQAATVTGPAGEEVHTNAYGDIKVQFHWDRYGPKNEKSSDWIRVAQGSAGGSFGSINTPRIGEEVLIDFINGDTDRPIVIGRLYNSANPPPWGYPQAAKQSGIKSKSFNSPLENFNELMFNDDAGFELVNFQAQRDLVSLVKNDETRTVNRDRTTTIDNDETITVHGFRTETVDKDETITIHQNRTEVVDLDETITIHKNRKERVDENETISIGGNRDETVHKSEQITIKGNRDKTVNGNDTLTVNKDRKETVNKSRSLTVDKNNTEFVKMGKSVTVGLAYATQVGTIMNTAVGIMQAEEIGRIKKTMVGKSYSISVGDKFEISVGSSKITMTQDSISITAKTILVGAENENVLIGKDVLINPPGASAGGIPADYDYEEGSTIPGTNTYVGEPDQGGGDGSWYEQDNRIAALYKESSQGVKDAMSSGMNKAGELKDRFVKGTIGAAQAARDSLAEQYNIVKNGVTSLPKDTTAALLTTMRWQGKDAGADYVNFETGAGFRNFGIKGDISVNVHTGDVYVPEIANASVNNSKYPNAGFDLSFGRLTENNGKSNAKATGDLLSGRGNSTSVGVGVLSGSRDRTDDGKVKGGSLGPSVNVGYKQSKIGVNQSSTNMKLSPDYRLDPKTDRIVHVGKK